MQFFPPGPGDVCSVRARLPPATRRLAGVVFINKLLLLLLLLLLLYNFAATFTRDLLTVLTTNELTVLLQCSAASWCRQSMRPKDKAPLSNQ